MTDTHYCHITAYIYLTRLSCPWWLCLMWFLKAIVLYTKLAVLCDKMVFGWNCDGGYVVVKFFWVKSLGQTSRGKYHYFSKSAAEGHFTVMVTWQWQLHNDDMLNLYSVIIFVDSIAGEVICLVASVCVCVCVRLSVGALLFELFDLWPWFLAWGSTLTLASLGL